MAKKGEAGQTPGTTLRAPAGCCSCPGPEGEPMVIPKSGVVTVEDPALVEILVRQHGFTVATE